MEFFLSARSLFVLSRNTTLTILKMTGKKIEQLLTQRLKRPVKSLQPLGGGSINATFKVITGDGATFFAKANSASKFPHLFSKETGGLKLIADQACVRTPEVIDLAEEDDLQVLVLSWINPGTPDSLFWKKFGEALAGLHRATAEAFGLGEDNYMGSVVQSNKQSPSWIHLFNHQRLAPLIVRCRQKELLSPRHEAAFNTLRSRLNGIFEEEAPALLHGDLWSGNFLCNGASEPVLIDPAVYYGHRSMDLAMTTLFGGFSTEFYEAYQYHFPLPSSYREQWEVCNLYPLLIHLLLFGKSYLPRIEKILGRFQ